MAHDPYKYFRIEARELLDQLGKGVLNLEKGGTEPEIVPLLLRVAHTLKGAARVVKQREIADLAHAVEDALVPFREGAVGLPRERVDGVLKLLDAIRAHVGALAAPAPSEASSAPEELFRTVRVDIEEMDALLDGVAEVHGQLAMLRRGSAAIERVRGLAYLLAEQLRSPRAQRPGDEAGAKSLSMAEELRGLVAALERSFGTGVEQVDRELRQVRQAAERLRLLPAGLMFTSLERAARDVAQSLGRRVSFETKGSEVRLDTHVLGVIQSALAQVVRNAVAHGIEAESERSAAGKSPEGKVILEVVRRGSRVSFVCRDDGRGVDLEAVRRIALRRGSLSGEAQKLGPEELLRVLLKGGISTSGAVTEISGRGIGLDVVREAASRLGGEVTVRTEAGTGTSIEILVPVSLSSLDALLVEAGNQAAAIPLESVRRTLRLSPTDVARTAEGESIVFEGKVIPFAPLARALRAGAATLSTPRARSAVVVEGRGALAAVGVDRMLGTERLVLRPLPELTPADPVLAGTSLDAEGNPQIVLDPDALVAEASRTEAATEAAPALRPPILVIDDSLTTRMLEQSILESAGYEVDLATSAEEALEKARRRRYALFLVDVEMPGMDGFAFVERTRVDPTLRDVPAILVTSRTSPEDRRRGEQVGARAYIVKSEFDQADLLERIRKLVG
jgi:two-component system chemotaxis sensor kinase CheA